MSPTLPLCHESAKAQILRIAFTGAIFAGIGAILNIYAPAFHKPTELLHKNLDKLNGLFSTHPYARHIFANNPLTGNTQITQFLAISAMETPFIAGAMVSAGAAMKATGIKFRRLDCDLTKNAPPLHR